MLGEVPADDQSKSDGVREPFENLLTQGMVRKGGAAMSSSTGNVVSPRPFVENYGADTGRLFMLNAAQPEKDFDWTEEGAQSAHDFLQNVYGLVDAFADGEVETGDDGTIDAYVDREIRATAATASEEFERFRFNHALQAVRDLVSLLRRYVDETEPSAETLENGLSTVTRLLSPVAPHVAEELWDLLDGEGLVAKADWPEADKPEHYEVEKRLVENTREDIRDIIEVAGIDDPARIEVAVAPDWKHRVRELAKEADGDVVGAVMSDDDLRQHGEAAADFAKEFIGQEHFDEQLPPAEESEVLDRATWLIEREFDAELVVYGPDEGPADLASKATPGRPGINIEE
jgi:leucyl-tRNA synthetase